MSGNEPDLDVSHSGAPREVIAERYGNDPPPLNRETRRRLERAHRAADTERRLAVRAARARR